MIRCVTLQSRKNTLRINTVGHNKIFTMFYKRKKKAKKICTYHNIFSSPLALIPSGMWYRPNNLKTQNKNHIVLFHASAFTNCRPNAYRVSLTNISSLHSFPYFYFFLKIWRQRNEILGAKPGIIDVTVKTILKSVLWISVVNLQS